MKEKVLLIVVDGMRPDAVLRCGNPYAMEFIKNGHSDLCAETVMPSVTLPCHMSLFLSVPPQRHGILANTYVPQARPVNGLFEVLKNAGKKSAMFYNWEELRDLGRPGTVAHSCYYADADERETDNRLTARTIEYIESDHPDFVFLYLGHTDAAGHRNGWMTGEYLSAVSNAWDCIKLVTEAVSEEYNVIVTADHGGHDRGHGTDSDEDMAIPVIINGFKVHKEGAINIMDLAPTVSAVLHVAPDKDWEGVCLL